MFVLKLLHNTAHINYPKRLKALLIFVQSASEILPTVGGFAQIQDISEIRPIYDTKVKSSFSNACG